MFLIGFYLFFIVKELLSPSWKKVSPIESVLPVWFFFEREKKYHFQIRPEVINFAYVLECSVVHQDVVARLALWRVLKGAVEKFFRIELFGYRFMLRWFGQVFPPWSEDHPLLRTPRWAGTSWFEIMKRKLSWTKNRTSCNFLHGFWIWPALELLWTQDDDAEEDGRCENLKYANLV